jgi:hypothetical protein
MAKKPEWKPKESDIQKTILDFLKLNDIFVYPSKAAGVSIDEGGKKRFYRTGIPGLPDITGVLEGGIALYIEVKRPGKKLSGVQSEFIGNVNDLGGVAFVATSIEDVRGYLGGYLEMPGEDIKIGGTD